MFTVTFELIQDNVKWSIHEIIHHVHFSIRLNNLIAGHKTNWPQNIKHIPYLLAVDNQFSSFFLFDPGLRGHTQQVFCQSPTVQNPRDILEQCLCEVCPAILRPISVSLPFSQPEKKCEKMWKNEKNLKKIIVMLMPIEMLVLLTYF